MRDGVRRAGLHAITAEDATVVVDVVNLRVTLGGRDALLFRILGRLNIDTVRRTCRSAQETRNALLQTVLIALQLMLAPEALLQMRTAHRPRPVGIVLDFRRLEHLAEGHAHSPGD